MTRIRNCLTILLFVTVFSSLSGCLYKTVRQQGNIIEKEQVNKIQIGSTKAQVQSLLGIPLLSHPFDTNQWIYLYQLRLSNGEFFRKHLIVHFNNSNQVIKLEKHHIEADAPSL